MGEKDIIELFGNPELLICNTNGAMKPVGKIVDQSISFEPEEKAVPVPIKNSFSFSIKSPDLEKLWEENKDLKSLKEAQAMYDRLRDHQAIWRKYYGKGMRKERRRIEREFKALQERLLKHCEHYGIIIKPTQK